MCIWVGFDPHSSLMLLFFPNGSSSAAAALGAKNSLPPAPPGPHPLHPVFLQLGMPEVLPLPCHRFTSWVVLLLGARSAKE